MMKNWMKWIVMSVTVWGVFAAGAWGGVVVTVAKTGTFSVTTPDGTKSVDQWIVSATSPLDQPITAFQMFATGPLFQVWQHEAVYDDNDEIIDYVDIPTQTMATARSLSLNQRNADSHFLQSSYIAIPSPEESSDIRFGTTPTRAFGVGSDTLALENQNTGQTMYLSTKVIAAVRQEDFTSSFNFFQAGCCPTDANAPIHLWGAVAAIGGTAQQIQDFDLWINRPAPCQWQGAGTGGNTASEPTDSTTQWNSSANWLDGKAPSAENDGKISMDCGGTVYAASAEMQYLYVDGESRDGRMKVDNETELSVNMNMFVGQQRYGHVIQEGGVVRVKGFPQNNAIDTRFGLFIGYAEGSTGKYELRSGQLIAEKDEFIGNGSCDGSFIQTGGTHSAKNLNIAGSGQGTGYLMEGGELVVSSKEVIDGHQFVQTGGRNTVDELHVNGTGSYNLSGGTLDAYSIGSPPTQFTFTGGRLQASMIFSTLVNDGGTFSPNGYSWFWGEDAGYTQNSGVLDIEITSLKNHDSINLSGNAWLGGELRVSFLDGYTPNYGDMFGILNSERIDSFTMTIPEDFYAVIYDNTLSLVYIPEPGSLALLGACAAASLMRRRRRALGG
jgi:hypothetical protein